MRIGIVQSVFKLAQIVYSVGDEKIRRAKSVEEIEVKGNNTGLKCYINGVCDLTLMSKEEMDLFVASIVPVLLEHYQNYVKRKGERTKNKGKINNKQSKTSWQIKANMVFFITKQSVSLKTK